MPAEGYYAGDPNAASPATTTRQATREQLTPDAGGLIIALVGLPARGKSFISRKVERFLLWKGFKTQTYNVGKYRRELEAPENSGRSEFFDASNKEAKAAREAAASAALADSLSFLDGGGQIVILDATNSTVERRSKIREQVASHPEPYALLFLEVICDDAEVLEINMMNKVTKSPDFAGFSVEDAIKDLKARISKYESVYETVQDDEGTYIKLFNMSSKVMAHNCYGRVARLLLPYVMGIHVGARPIWLCRAGGGEVDHANNLYSALSAQGRQFAEALPRFVRERNAKYWTECGKEGEAENLPVVVTSTLPRAVASVAKLTDEPELSSALNHIDTGAIGTAWWEHECNNMPAWELVKERNPEFYERFVKNPLHCRFPGGEAYADVLARLEGILLQIEMHTRPVLIVSHVTCLQVLASYFKGSPIEDCWKLPIPRGRVMEVVPSMGGGFCVEEFTLGSDA
mmetsp:Transcript_46054/g.84427  ORF Transcript_46054/g.84427 Transcript_46054/m.84427 type:complete len:460 (-) Transcript_46054:95-1474(-)